MKCSCLILMMSTEVHTGLRTMSVCFHRQQSYPRLTTLNQHTRLVLQNAAASFIFNRFQLSWKASAFIIYCSLYDMQLHLHFNQYEPYINYNNNSKLKYKCHVLGA